MHAYFHIKSHSHIRCVDIYCVAFIYCKTFIGSRTKWYTDKMVLDKMVWTKWYE